MALSDAQGLANVILSIQAPLLGTDYVTSYSGYIDTVRYVTDLFGTSRVLSHDRSGRVGLDSVVVDSPVVSEAEGRFGSAGPSLNVATACVVHGRADSGDPDLADNRVVADAAGSTSGGGTVVASLAVDNAEACDSVCGGVAIGGFIGFENGTGRSVPSANLASDIDRANGRIDHSGLVVGEGAQCSGRDPGVSGGNVDHGVRGSIFGRRELGIAEATPIESANDTGGVERHTFPSDSLSWRKVDGKINMNLDNERLARSSFWQRRHIENCLAIKRGVKAIEDAESGTGGNVQAMGDDVITRYLCDVPGYGPLGWKGV